MESSHKMRLTSLEGSDAGFVPKFAEGGRTRWRKERCKAGLSTTAGAAGACNLRSVIRSAMRQARQRLRAAQAQLLMEMYHKSRMPCHLSEHS